MQDIVVGSFNIHHCEGSDGVLDVARAARAIVSLGASVTVLQELDVGMARSGGADQVAELSDAIGSRIWFHPTLRGKDGGLYGIGVAGPGTMTTEARTLPRAHPDEEPRAATISRLGPLTIVGTHLSLRPDTRMLQLAALADVAEEAPGPVIVAGDLNQEPPSEGPLTSAGISGPRPPVTFPSSGRRLDHVLAGKGAVVRAVWVVLSEASDHLPLGGRVEF